MKNKAKHILKYWSIIVNVCIKANVQTSPLV